VVSTTNPLGYSLSPSGFFITVFVFKYCNKAQFNHIMFLKINQLKTMVDIY